jgi:long-chain fatty acid transport protein
MRNLIIAFTILAPASALAGGYVIPNENARDLALSEATVADQHGPEALFLNIAALAGPEGLAVSSSGELLVNRTTWSDPNLGTATLVPQNNTPAVGAISFGQHFGSGMAWGIGAGAGIPAGGRIVWPNSWPGQQFIQTVDQKVYVLGVGGAFQPLPYVQLGVSYLRYQATEVLRQELNFLDHFGDADLGLSGGANSFGLALQVKFPNIPLSLGANYKHSGNLGLSGDAHFTAVPASFTPMIHDQAVSEQLTIPNVLAVGAAYAVVPNIKLMFTYSWERWSVYTEDKFVGADGFTVVVPRNYQNAHVYRAGIEWNLEALPEVTARFGGLRSISPQPTDTISPSLTDGDSWAFSIGAGVNATPNLRLDAGYQHAIFDAVTASGTETLPGTYKTHVDLFSIGFSWRTDLGLTQPH